MNKSNESKKKILFLFCTNLFQNRGPRRNKNSFSLSGKPWCGPVRKKKVIKAIDISCWGKIYKNNERRKVLTRSEFQDTIKAIQF